MKIITWNVNSVRLRIEQVARLVAAEQPDVLCLQEIKCREAEFPMGAFRDMGYGYVRIAGQKGYHGVATAARRPFEAGPEIAVCRHGEARHISVRLDGIDVHNFYLPAGGDEADRALNPKFDHKLSCFEALEQHFMAQPSGQKVVLCGDLNIAPHEHDVFDHKYMSRVVSHTPVEIETMARLRDSYDFTDVARLHVPLDQKLFTWWSYRAADFRASNRGLRLDHIWVSPALRDRAQAGQHTVLVDARSWERPSDHAPVMVSLAV
jgi:exodeoxyribonuclease-3